MRAFLFYIDDWLSSKKVALMDAHEERGYLRLLLHAATEPDCGLPNNDTELSLHSKLGEQWWKPTKEKAFRIGEKTSGDKLRECFFLREGRLYNARLLREYEHQLEVHKKRAEAGRKGGRPKANEKLLLSPEKANGIANGKQNETNDVCVCVSSPEGEGFNKGSGLEFDYETGFNELWSTYPRKGRTKIMDSQHLYYETVNPDPFRIHEALMAPIRPGGNATHHGRPHEGRRREVTI